VCECVCVYVCVYSAFVGLHRAFRDVRLRVCMDIKKHIAEQCIVTPLMPNQQLVCVCVCVCVCSVLLCFVFVLFLFCLLIIIIIIIIYCCHCY